MSRLIYLIAGEPSGDRLGADLMHALRAEEPDIRFAGLGGIEMRAAGLEPLFDITELSVMGLVEVLPRLPSLLRRMSEVTADVLAKNPDALITIDSPSFSLRVAERVRKASPQIPTIHYVAPSVWAWRPGRAKQMAAYIDHVLALLPFEPPYMEAAGMTCDFVGHPVAARDRPDPSALADQQRRWTGGTEMPCLLLAPGSRKGEVRRLMPLYREVLQRLQDDAIDFVPIIPVAETVRSEVHEAAATLPSQPVFILPEDGEDAKRLAFAAVDAALVASGTITLEMAAARTPMVAVYKTNWLTAQIVRRIVKVSTANLINLVAAGNPVPEFLQEYATVDAVGGALSALLLDPDARADQLVAFEKVIAELGGGAGGPAGRAARSVLAHLG
ncbi:MAG: lipid-A-disaccharide synthase [Pseudomonadota bacterium]